MRIAMLPRGLDGVFLPPIPDVETMALVARGTPEEAWARQVFPASCVLPYTYRGSDHGPYPATADVLSRSDIHAVLRKSRTRSLLLSTACSPEIHAWARLHGVQLLMPEYDLQRRLEDKIQLDALLRRHALPRPRGGAFTLGRASLPVRGPAVVQVPDSMGGEGTFFVRSPGDLEKLVRRGALRPGERYLAREHIQGRPFGVTIFVAPGLVALSAARLQCYYPTQGESSYRFFAGIQWLATGVLAADLRRRIDETLLSLGELLYRRRFFGFANVDFMVDAKDQVFVIECNPRMSAATPQLLRDPALLGGVPAGALFVQGFAGKRRFSRAFARRGMPDSDYQGATLDIVHRKEAPAVVVRDIAIGRYTTAGQHIACSRPEAPPSLDGSSLFLYWFARKGQVCQQADTLGAVLSDTPLYTGDGELDTPAHRLLSCFDGTSHDK